MGTDVGRFRTEEGHAEYVRCYESAFAGLPAPAVVHDMPTSFGTVRAYEWNTTASGTPVVLVPGRSSGVPMWAYNLPGFTRSHRVIAFDALGDAGLSVQTKPYGSFGDLAAWMDEVVDTLAPRGIHLVGHSFGGATAAAYACRFSRRVTSLALLEPVLTFAWPPPALMFWTVLGSLPFLPEATRNKALGKIGGEDFDAAADEPMAQMIAAGTRHFAAQLPNPRPLTTEEAGRLTMPVYVALADRDSVAGGAKAAANAAKLLPRATVTTWPDTTHSLPMQVAGQLDDVLHAFWEKADQ